jgi:hypothetical protein
MQAFSKKFILDLNFKCLKFKYLFHPFILKFKWNPIHLSINIILKDINLLNKQLVFPYQIFFINPKQYILLDALFQVPNKTNFFRNYEKLNNWKFYKYLYKPIFHWGLYSKGKTKNNFSIKKYFKWLIKL